MVRRAARPQPRSRPTRPKLRRAAPATYRRRPARVAAKRVGGYTGSRPPSATAERLKRLASLLTLSLLALLVAAYFTYTKLLPRVFTITDDHTIVFVSESILEQEGKLYFVHLSPTDKNTVFLSLPGREEVTVLGGYGTYELQSVFPLLRLDKKDSQFIRAAFSHAFNVVVDEVIWVEPAALSQPEQDLHQLFRSALQERESQEIGTTQLLRYFFHTLAHNKKAKPLETIADVPSQLSAVTSIFAREEALQCPVAVVNTTSTTGLAQNMSGILEDSGALVIRVASESNQEPTSRIVAAAATPECQRIIDSITKMLPVSPVYAENEDVLRQYRARLVLFLGEDIAKVLEN